MLASSTRTSDTNWLLPCVVLRRHVPFISYKKTHLCLMTRNLRLAEKHGILVSRIHFLPPIDTIHFHYMTIHLCLTKRHQILVSCIHFLSPYEETYLLHMRGHKDLFNKRRVSFFRVGIHAEMWPQCADCLKIEARQLCVSNPFFTPSFDKRELPLATKTSI